MINNITIITTDYSILTKEFNCLDYTVNLAFVINDRSFFQQISLPIIHQAVLLNKTNIHFSFYFNFSCIDTDVTDNLLLPYFFHPNYFLSFGKPVLCFNSSARENDQLQIVIAKLELLASNQGYPGIEIVYFTDNEANINATDHLFLNQEHTASQIKSIYFKLMVENFYASKYIAIASTNLEEQLAALFQAEFELKTHKPEQFYALTKIFELEKQYANLQCELKITKQELENQKLYLNVFKDKDEALKINEFYQNEYEILPVWYKKFGHILKVLTGKRSFRSLFDNNVKKYNN